MFTVKSSLSLLLSPTVFSGGTDKRHRRVFSRSHERRRVQIQASISGGDSKTTTSSPVESKESNVSVPLGSSGGRSSGEVINVKAVVTIRKKMKGNNIVEDRLEYFINGAGQGIQIRLVSEEIDPGLFHFILIIILLFLFFFNIFNTVMMIHFSLLFLFSFK